MTSHYQIVQLQFTIISVAVLPLSASLDEFLVGSTLH